MAKWMDQWSLQKPNYAGFVVIGAGLPRTGTSSLRAALGHLLGKCMSGILILVEGAWDFQGCVVLPFKARRGSQYFTET